MFCQLAVYQRTVKGNKREVNMKKKFNLAKILLNTTASKGGLI